MVDGRKVSLGPSGSRGSSKTKALSKSKVMYLAEVIAVEETYAANRIKVKLEGFDNGLSVGDYSLVFPIFTFTFKCGA